MLQKAEDAYKAKVAALMGKAVQELETFADELDTLRGKRTRLLNEWVAEAYRGVPPQAVADFKARLPAMSEDDVLANYRVGPAWVQATIAANWKPKEGHTTQARMELFKLIDAGPSHAGLRSERIPTQSEINEMGAHGEAMIATAKQIDADGYQTEISRRFKIEPAPEFDAHELECASNRLQHLYAGQFFEE